MITNQRLLVGLLFAGATLFFAVQIGHAVSASINSATSVLTSAAPQ